MNAQDRLMLMIGQLFAQIAQLQFELETARAALAEYEKANNKTSSTSNAL